MRFLIKTFAILLSLVVGFSSSEARRISNKSYNNTAPFHWYIHQIGDVWNRQTNWGMFGDDDFVYPSCDFPGGSQNAYLYQGSIWVLGIVEDSLGNPDTLCTAGDELEFGCLGTVHVVTGEEALSQEDTYTTYNDLYPVSPEGVHRPLGIAVTEKTYALAVDYANNFIIAEYWIKNIGIDTDEDTIPDTPRTIRNLFVSIRMDCDISSLAGSDDLWYWDDMVDYDATNKLSYMYDADNSAVPGDDTGNPDAQGNLISPGYIGARLLHTPHPSGMPYSHRWCHYYNDPPPNAPQYRFIAEDTIDPLPIAPYDYRFMQTTGPIDSLVTGDSLLVVWAYGVGNGLEELKNILQTAQRIFDNNYLAALPPPSPTLVLEDYVENGTTVGVRIQWNNSPEDAVDPLSLEEDFEGYRVWVSESKDPAGERIWQLLASFDIVDSIGEDTGLPPKNNEGYYEIIHLPVIKGFAYTYSVTAFDKGDTVGGLESLESSKLFNLQDYIPTNPIATSLDNIRVVPNPYIGSAPWNNPRPHYGVPWTDRIQFVNLPADAVVRIYTLDGDFVREVISSNLIARTPKMTSECKSVAEWDLLSRNKQKVTPGLYLYVVESSLGTKKGKFVIIR